MMSLEELRLAADELPVAIWMGRVPSGEAVYTNRAFREVLGIEPPPGAARGVFVEPYGVHQLDGQPYPEDRMPFERAISARALVILDDLVIHRRDGRTVNLRVFAKPLFDANGEITHVLEAFTDITHEVGAEAARLEVERKLMHAHRLESIGQLVMGIAHDFNNLLTVTTLTTSRLLSQQMDPAMRSALGDIETVTNSATDLVAKLLAFARRTPQPLAPVDLASISQLVVPLCQRTFGRDVTLSTQGDLGAWIRGDPAQLEQALMNLLVNARDAIQGPGTITVRCSRRALADGEVETCPAGAYAVLEVTDDGVGIAASIRDHLFDPYFTTKERGSVKGTGLGLSTVLGIVRVHAGFVEAVAAKPRGTTIRIAIPATDA
ncbi:MAG: ATP-binding protein [Myxococcota bacterium]|nr:ATP-binding protein [Myxococcota bacterium]